MSADATPEQKTDVPSARPTSAPDIDMTALAVACCHQRHFAVPLDLFIPVRSAATVTELEHRDAFLLFHADGESNVAMIAERASLSLDEVVTAFHRLTAMGIVTMTASSESLRAPESGVYRRMELGLEDGAGG